MTESSNSLMRLPDTSGRLPERYSIKEATSTAIACRTIAEVFAHATISQLCSLSPTGRAEVGVAAMAIIEKGMAYFATNRRLSSEHVALFSEEVVDQFMHESLADLNVFMRKAAMGGYGDGETFGALDLPRLGSWWREYLGEKADERERIERQRTKQLAADTIKGLASIPGILPMLQKIGDDRKEEREQTSLMNRILRLQHTVPEMTDEQLRDAYVFYRTADERKIIMIEADKRGLVKVAMDKALEEVTETPPAAA